MTVQLNIRSDAKALLAEKAHARGMSLEQFLEQILEQEAIDHTAPAPTSRPMSGAERARAFRGWVKSFPADLPVLSLEDLSRENIYRRD